MLASLEHLLETGRQCRNQTICLPASEDQLIPPSESELHHIREFVFSLLSPLASQPKHRKTDMEEWKKEAINHSHEWIISKLAM